MPKIAIISSVMLIFLYTQGGGVWSVALRVDKTFYWQKEWIIEANMKARDTYDNFVIEKNVFRRI
jgi:hypothetical protein